MPVLYRFHVTARLAGQTDDEAEAFLALIDQPRLLPRDDRFDKAVHVLYVDPVPRYGFAVRLNLQLRQSRSRFYFHVLGAGHTAHDRADSVGSFLERVEVVTEELDRDVGAHAGDQLRDAQFDRLREAEGGVRYFFLQRLRHLFDQPLLGVHGLPFRRRLQLDVEVAEVHAHRVGGDLGAARFRDHPGDFGEGLERPFDFGDGADGLRQRDAGQLLRLHRERPLVETRDELRPEEREDGPAYNYQRHRGHERRPAIARHRGEGRAVQFLRVTDDDALRIGDVPAQEEGHCRRNVSERKQQRAEQREDYGQRHGLEHLALDSGQTEYRQVDDHNNRHREDYRTPYLHAGFENRP